MGKQEKAEKLYKEWREVLEEMKEISTRMPVALKAYYKETNTGPWYPIDQSPYAKLIRQWYKLEKKADKLAMKIEKLQEEIERANK